jgi:hypothetical protein
MLEMVGAGGAGGGGVGELPGGVGGGGAYTKTIVSVTPGATYTVVVGTGGIGVDGGTGGNGGASQFLNPSDTVLAFANGGSGAPTLVPGPGGTTTGNSGTFVVAGTAGGGGFSFVTGGKVYGTGGAGGPATGETGEDQGSNGAAGAVVVWW